MRLGRNPAKEASRLADYGRHRVIVPVYIPHHDGYFAGATEILSLCLTSLRKTTEGRAAITVVANGCCQDVRELLHQRFLEGWFDQLVLNETNRGKVDALASLARGVFEPFVTLSDCDVIFRAGWLEAVEDVFRHFPHAGIVSPIPAPPVMWHHTSSTLVGAMVRRQLRFAKVVDDLALEQLSASVGDPFYVPSELRRAQLTVQRQGHVACVGGPHIACVMRREIAAAIPPLPSRQALAKGSESSWFDAPIDERGFWRLSTPQAFAMHMGNGPEPWMAEEVRQLMAASAVPQAVSQPIPDAVADWPRHLSIRLRRRLVGFLQKDAVRERFFRWVGPSETRLTAAPGAVRS